MQAEYGRARVIAKLLTDSASYYVRSQRLEMLLRQLGIVHIASPPYTQELNGVSESTMRVVMCMVRAMLHQAGAPKKLWGYAVMYACYILNRLPRSVGDTRTRLDYWNGHTDSHAHEHVRIWGCAAYVHANHKTGPKQDKLQVRSELHVFLGYSETRQAYVLGTLAGFKLVYSAHVTFNETSFPLLKTGEQHQLPQLLPQRQEVEEMPAAEPSPEGPRRQPRVRNPSPLALEALANGPTSPPDYDTDQALTVDQIMTIDDASLDNVFALSPTETPKDFNGVLAATAAEKAKWIQAVVEEAKSHAKNNTFGPAIRRSEIPSQFTPIPVGAVWKVKRDGRYKYRLAVRGYRMRPGIDYNETFAPVAHITTLRAAFALAAKLDWEVDHGDVSSAFLSAFIDSVVYVELPAEFSMDPLASHARSKPTYHLMIKSCYGIPQGPHLYNKKSHNTMTEAGMTRSLHDYSLYTHPDLTLVVIVWVDDLFFFYPRESKAAADKLYAHLQSVFDLKDRKPIEDCLACEVTRDRPNRTLTLSQASAVEAVLAKAGMSECNPAPTPVLPSAVFTQKDADAANTKDHKWYRSSLMSLNYMSMWTRPDISLTVSKLAKFMKAPGQVHVVALKRLLRYMRGTTHMGLVYDFSSKPRKRNLYAYLDASWADDEDTRRSTLAYIYFFENCPISWHTRLHAYVTSSTNHTEYCAAAKASKEARHQIYVFTELAAHIPELQPQLPLPMFSDSRGSITMTQNPVQRSASKHIEVADHYAREMVDRGFVTVTHVPTDRMLADILTKALTAAKFLFLRAFIVKPTKPQCHS